MASVFVLFLSCSLQALFRSVKEVVFFFLCTYTFQDKRISFGATIYLYTPILLIKGKHICHQLLVEALLSHGLLKQINSTMVLLLLLIFKSSYVLKLCQVSLFPFIRFVSLIKQYLFAIFSQKIAYVAKLCSVI